ncbi:MAG TPA: hypothetical protein VEF72_03660 [Mycobacterium sp.]|nr:hypothetical protein [Mycobacterium sp.]
MTEHLHLLGVVLALRQSYLSSGTETPALWIFLVCYVALSVLTRAMYVRRPVSAR